MPATPAQHPVDPSPPSGGAHGEQSTRASAAGCPAGLLLGTAFLALLCSGCPAGGDDDCFGRRGRCPEGEYCAFQDPYDRQIRGEGYSSCVPRFAEGDACGPSTEPDACDEGWGSDGYETQCAIEREQQCLEGATCRRLGGVGQHVCSAGQAGSPCRGEEDCDGAADLICAGPQDSWALQRCSPAGYLGQGEACERGEECAEGLLCRRAASCREPSTCAPPAELKASCCADPECLPELTCLTFEPQPYCWRADDGEEQEPCDTDRHCGGGLACVEGERGDRRCRAPGAVGAPCQQERHCQDGLACVALTPGRCSSGAAGEPCQVNEDCAGELLCDPGARLCEAR